MHEAALATFYRRGFVHLKADAPLTAWAAAARPVAERLLADPGHRRDWLRCGGTWFAGVNLFPNAADGSVAAEGVPALAGEAVGFIARLGFDTVAWDAAQISVCLPGYPQPWEAESEANFRYRRDRDAAHVDGLLRDGARRRSVGEAHGFLLGIPLVETPPGAAPFVIWEGSHEVMRAAFAARLSGVAACNWAKEDVTEAYVAARKQAFAQCPRVEVHARPGEAYVVHRLTLHGVAPWREEAFDGARIIAYFRPDPRPGDDLGWWLAMP